MTTVSSNPYLPPNYNPYNFANPGTQNPNPNVSGNPVANYGNTGSPFSYGSTFNTQSNPLFATTINAGKNPALGGAPTQRYSIVGGFDYSKVTEALDYGFMLKGQSDQAEDGALAGITDPKERNRKKLEIMLEKYKANSSNLPGVFQQAMGGSYAGVYQQYHSETMRALDMVRKISTTQSNYPGLEKVQEAELFKFADNMKSIHPDWDNDKIAAEFAKRNNVSLEKVRYSMALDGSSGSSSTTPYAGTPGNFSSAVASKLSDSTAISAGQSVFQANQQLCARGVKTILQKQLGLPYLGGEHAYQMTAELSKYGNKFTKVKINPSDIASLPAGVIVVIDKNSSSPTSGHIMVTLDGGKEISDRVRDRSTMTPPAGTEVYAFFPIGASSSGRPANA
jgi:hypothetical protein